jgi:iron complex outermembrane recepter protein
MRRGIFVVGLMHAWLSFPSAGGTSPTLAAPELSAHLPIDLGSLLGRELSNITAVRRGGVASDIVLRGLGRDNLTVLLDGASAHAACPGRMDPPVFHVSTPLVGRVTIHAGPFDVRHGAAPGGSVNVASAEAPRQPLALAGLLVGTNDLVASDMAAGGPLGAGWRGLAGASWQQGRSYRDGSGRRQTELAGGNYRPEVAADRAFAIAHAEVHAVWARRPERTLTVRAAGNEARDVFYPALLMDARRDRSTRLGAEWSSTAPSPLADHWRAEAYHNRVQHDMSDAARTSAGGLWGARGYMMRTVAATTSYGLTGEAERSRPAGDLAFGGQLTVRNWVADNVVGATANPMLPDATTRQAGAFVQAERAGSRWRVKAGGRLDGWETEAARPIALAQRAHGTTRNRRVDAHPSGFVLGERNWDNATALFAGVGHGARIPDPQERYIIVDRPAAGTDWVGNPNLGVVRSTELTAGARLRLGFAHFKARWFAARLQDFIVLGRLVPAAGSSANATRTESYFGVNATLTGAEISADVEFAPQWKFTLSSAAQQGRREFAAPGAANRDLPEIPPWQGRATLRWSAARQWIEAECPWAARQTRLDASVGERPLPGYGVLHLRAGRAVARQLTLSLGVENVLDRDYATHNAYTRDPFSAGLIMHEPGRGGYVRLQWRL